VPVVYRYLRVSNNQLEVSRPNVFLKAFVKSAIRHISHCCLIPAIRSHSVTHCTRRRLVRVITTIYNNCTRLHGKPIKLKIHRVTPGTIWAKMLRKTSSEISRKHFSVRLNWLFSFLTIQYATNKDLCLRLKDGRCLVYLYQSVLIKRHPFKLT